MVRSLAMWPADFEEQVKRESVVAIGVQGHDRFESLRNEANAQCGNAGDLKKNAMYIAALLDLQFEAGIKGRSGRCGIAVESGGCPRWRRTY